MTPPCILCYHKVDRRVEFGVTRLSPRRFARQMERLARTGYTTLTLAELRACLTGVRRPARTEIAITFDDGYRALRDHAFPVLAAHGFTAICFVVTDYAGKLNRWDVAYGGRRFAHLAWRDMRRWQSRGIEFGSHTATHPRLTWLDEREVTRELAQSRGDLRAALDVDPYALSWPFGAHAQRERAIAQREGYELAFTIGGARSCTGDLFAVPRHPVYMWSPPMPGVGHLRRADALAGTLANRCAIGTSIIRRRSGADAVRSRLREVAPAVE
ncbi:MAG TPA: polysaccharide deacetylase family protein [Gemmatimonadaceae bacterium]|nr:polysaccharide deacetylase family protein [Gemmatimonadaceae bacterium]